MALGAAETTKSCPSVISRGQSLLYIHRPSRDLAVNSTAPEHPAYRWGLRYNCVTVQSPIPSLPLPLVSCSRLPFECLSVCVVSGVFCVLDHLTTHWFAPSNTLVSQVQEYARPVATPYCFGLSGGAHRRRPTGPKVL